MTKDGFLCCERLRVSDIANEVGATPFYLYSRAVIEKNYRAYKTALEGRDALVCYAIKANANLSLLRLLKRLGAGATLVSGNELSLALDAGFDPARLILNGNGKTRPELESALRSGVTVNVDSAFDLEHIIDVASASAPARVLIRVNPDIDPNVHPYVSTGIRESKFGIAAADLGGILDRIRRADNVDVAGVHCHLGSTISHIGVFAEAATYAATVVKRMRGAGFAPRVINLGGGLGVDYEGVAAVPSPADVIGAALPHVPKDVRLVVEPGRSIVADAGVLVMRVLGVKPSGARRFVVVDASMAELLRPSLYDAYHRIGAAAPANGPTEEFDVVGPVCESGDFLAKGRALATPAEGDVLVAYDAGAYGYAMSSNYNLRMRPAEYLVDGNDLRCVRRAETLADHARLFDVDGRES